MSPRDWACRIAAGLRDIGVVAGDTVLVHSSFKSLGPVPGGIETVVQGLLLAVGSEGTLLMPALSWALRPPEIFDVRLTTSNVGAIPEYFRTAGQVLHFLAAHYVVGDPEPADKILRAMLERQGRGEFQNGVRDAYPTGMDWTTWDGKPSGYEGYLADSFRFLQAVLLHESKFRDRLYRPLNR
jgi:hypothetical protein